MTERPIGVKLSFARTKYRYGFSRNEDLLGFFDDDGKFMTDEEVADRLNELNIENVKLKEANKNLKRKIIELSHKLKNNGGILQGEVMTENKRFKLSYPNGAFLIDGDEPLCHMKNDLMIIDLLNEQHETIQSLISDSEKYRKLSIQFDNRNRELVGENALLEKENEQLKKDVEFFKGYRGDLEEVVVENEELKSEITILLKSINGNDCLKNKDCFKIVNRIKELVE